MITFDKLGNEFYEELCKQRIKWPDELMSYFAENKVVLFEPEFFALNEYFHPSNPNVKIHNMEHLINVIQKLNDTDMLTKEMALVLTCINGRVIKHFPEHLRNDELQTKLAYLRSPTVADDILTSYEKKNDHKTLKID